MSNRLKVQSGLVCAAIAVTSGMSMAAPTMSNYGGFTAYSLLQDPNTLPAGFVPAGNNLVSGVGTAMGLNSSDTVASSYYWKQYNGNFQRGSSVTAFTTGPANGYKPLAPLDAPMLAPSTVSYAAAYSVNDSAIAVGAMSTSNQLLSSAMHATVWTSGVSEVLAGFSSPGAGTETSSALYSVNSSGNAAGVIVTSSGNHAGYYSYAADTYAAIPTTLTVNGNTPTIARGISNTNVVVGTAAGTATSTRGFMYNPSNPNSIDSIPLPANLGSYSYVSGGTPFSYTGQTANNISPDGRYVVGTLFGGTSAPSFQLQTGEATTGIGNSQGLGYIYDATTQTSTVLPTIPGITSYQPYSVNDYGWVVGYAFYNNNPIGFLYDGVSIYNLQSLIGANGSLAVTGVTPFAINDNFTISGTGMMLQQWNNNGLSIPATLSSGFVAQIAVPEPGIAGAFGAASLALAMGRRRRA